MSTESDPLLLHSPRPYAQSYASTATTSSQVACNDTSVRLGFSVPAQIDNTGSTARDFYAAERNYLSWLRLSLAVMSAGAVALSDMSGGHNPFDDAELSRLYIWLAACMDEYNEIVGLALFSVATFSALAALAVFYHSHAQLALARRPLRWSSTILMSTTFAVTVSALVVSSTTMFFR
ncbi:hypothetical protein IWW56_004023 [Coemansia sp. RSA 2131]|nr:hypothetical protein IWW56_004023 [Coemansia sp. RSA 2131]